MRACSPAALLALLVGGLGVSACARSEAPSPPNVLIVTIDTLRADRLGCYGYGLARTPVVDRLAAEGVRCTDAATSAPITLPAHSSIMTGLYPPAHGVRDNGNYALGPEAVTLGERLGAAGYHTGAFVSAAVLARRYGLDQGFGVYDDELWAEDEPPLFMIRERTGERTAERAVAWLDAWKAGASDEPFFLWMHLFDPHQPHDAESIELAVMTPTPYDLEVAEADVATGRVVDWLRREGVLDHTLVVVTADHGESLGEHGEPTHGIFVYDATIRVPLVWRLPGVLPAGVVYPGPVRHIDIAPTVLGIVGVDGTGMQGVDLLPALRGEQEPPALAQYAEARLAEEGFGMAPLFGVRQGGRKWIAAPRPELYDLAADPREQKNLYPEAPAAAKPLEETLAAVEADSAERALDAPTREIDRETEEMLRALGYLAPPEERAAMAGRDPKDGIAVYTKMQEARQLAQVKQWDRATVLLNEILAEVPDNVSARNLLALGAVQRGDFDGAKREYEASLGHQPRQHRVLGALGAMALRQNDLVGAERRLNEALELAPTFVEAMSNLGMIAAMRGDEAGAQYWYERATAADPTYPHVNRRLADLFYDRKEYARALDYYRRVLETVPEHFEARIQAGNCARFLDDPGEATRYYGAAATLRPDSWIPPYNLACVQTLAGQPDAAMESLRTAVERGLASTALLDDNTDFASLRALAGWTALRESVRTAARQGTGGRRPAPLLEGGGRSPSA
jgi:arylsulfatase A-like enzyme/Tfp pilus assembly protein PilF